MNDDLLIGAHTSAAGGAYRALLEGQAIGATTIQLFTANQRRWESNPLTQKEIDVWHATLAETALRKIMSHDSYLINLGAPNFENLQKSRHAFQKEIQRCLALKISYLNFHPGSALQEDPQRCLDLIVESLLLTESQLGNQSDLRLLLETTAGQGSTQGYRFEQLGYIVAGVKDRIPIGVCVDTCHIFAAGYDIRSKESWETTLQAFDDSIGLEYLHAFHLNDSLKGLGSRVDRHSPIGQGQIGIDSFRFLMTDPRTRSIPKYLETPGGPVEWGREISLLRQFAEIIL